MTKPGARRQTICLTHRSDVQPTERTCDPWLARLNGKVGSRAVSQRRHSTHLTRWE